MSSLPLPLRSPLSAGICGELENPEDPVARCEIFESCLSEGCLPLMR
ncbi:MAG: hypothetical protein VYD19_02375 [Myxococcota bacterium]|nr:hypothetical protein [Myxococcota bacterium]